MIKFERPVGVLKGVGAEVERKLARLNIFTVGDLLQHYPRRYEDFSKISPIRAMKSGPVTFRAEIVHVASRYARTRKLHITEAVLSDGTGTVKAIWFNQPYMIRSLKKGSEVYISGKLEFRNNDLALQSPVIEAPNEVLKDTARIVPIYPETDGLTSRQLRTLILPLLDELEGIPETLPEPVITDNKLLVRAKAMREIHFPSSPTLLNRAKQRLAFGELFFLILASLVIKHEIKTETAPVIHFNTEQAQRFTGLLGFDLTDAQRRAAWEILQDMTLDQPMNRLLEGDVGSGKTVVAAMAIAMALANGYQATLMVPTEILARQHYANLAPIMSSLGYEIELLIGSHTKKTKDATKERAKTGAAHLVIGTQALLTGDTTFDKLGLVIIDEQHRFGVAQRQLLKQKAGYLPHLLSMTATPIPRSLALTVYGDLDISVIDELPPGRLPVETKIIERRGRAKTYEAIENLITAGQQVFVVCPLIEDSDTFGSASVTAEAERLRQGPFAHRRIGILHGKLSTTEKQAVMADFAAGKLDILVATAVIEVGVDIPNASVMLIEGAERFGLAALHQLRGRVGRGREQGYCYLATDSRATTTLERLAALERTTDGFRLAQIDLELRGPGQIYGLRQHGDLDLQFADYSDPKLLAAVRKAALAFLSEPGAMVKYGYVTDRVNTLKAVTSLD
jgi:ATP-dependent DNA helicase RecG